MTMKASDHLIKKIKEFEGYSPKAYRCPAGIWTCGWGHVNKVKKSTTCTPEVAERWLQQDLDPAERAVSNMPEIDTQWKADAIIDFIFNLGLGNFLGSTLYKKIKARASDDEICDQLMRWVYSKGKRLDGLVRRREWECRRWRGWK